MRVKFYYKDETKNYESINKKVREPKNWGAFSDNEKIDYLMNRYYYETLTLASLRCPYFVEELEYITINDVKYPINHFT